MKGFVFLTILTLINHTRQTTSTLGNGAACPSSPSSFLTVSDYENYARENLPKDLRDVILRGATDDDVTLRGNLEGFSKFKVLPRYLRDISKRTTKVEILGRQFSMPIGVSPSDLHKRWHVDGEKETVRGAAQSGSIMILSVASSTLLEEVGAAGGPEAEMWVQTFIFENRTLTLEYMSRAKSAGFRAIVLTIDRPVLPLRYFNIRNKFKDIYPEVNLVPYLERGKVAKYSSWADVKMLVDSKILPIIIKGILTPEDALLAKEAGARGIIVSNHGGRQLDGTISSIEALYMIGQQHPELVAKGTTNNDFDIYLDSGVRNGLDVFRALALGAKFVFVGRPAIWGLYHSGHQGITAVLDILRRELDTVMGQAGCNNVTCLDPALLKYYP